MSKNQNSITAFGKSYKATALVDRNVAANYLGVSTTTINAWAANGRLPARKESERKTRFLVKDLIDFNAGKNISVVKTKTKQQKTPKLKPSIQVDLELEITGWYDGRCYQAEGVTTMTSILYENFVDWMVNVRKIPLDSIPARVHFSHELKAMGFTQTKPRETYFDIGLNVKRRATSPEAAKPVIFFEPIKTENVDNKAEAYEPQSLLDDLEIDGDSPDIAMIYVKFRSGEPFTDRELEAGIGHFQTLADLAFKSGPEFRMMARTAQQVANRLKEYLAERNEYV